MYGVFIVIGLINSGSYFRSSVLRHVPKILQYLAQFCQGVSSCSDITEPRKAHLAEINDLCLQVLSMSVEGACVHTVREFAFSKDIITLIKFGNIKESLALIYLFCESPQIVMSIVISIRDEVTESLTTQYSQLVASIISSLTF